MLVVRKCLHVIVSSQLGAAATVQNTLHATINVAFQVCKLESFLIMLEGQDCLVRRTEQDHESGGSGLVQVEGLSKGEKKRVLLPVVGAGRERTCVVRLTFQTSVIYLSSDPRVPIAVVSDNASSLLLLLIYYILEEVPGFARGK